MSGQYFLFEKNLIFFEPIFKYISLSKVERKNSALLISAGHLSVQIFQERIMLVNCQLNLLKKVSSFLAITLFLGLLASLSGQTVVAQIPENAIQAAKGMPDKPAFIDDNFKPVLAGANATVSRTLVQPDGKILVAGTMHQVGGVNKNAIARFNPDGSLDTLFNTKSGANASITAIGLQSDGKIIIGGNFTIYDGQSVGSIARLNPDGSFDATFNSAGMYNTPGATGGTINDISITADNRIYIGGGFTAYNGTSIARFARLYPEGNLDTSFVTGTGPNSSINVIKQQTDGKILIGGGFANYNSNVSARLARVNTDGSFDPTFVVGTGAANTVRTIVLESDGKIVIGGQFATYNSVAKNGVARLNADGSIDAAFNVSGTGASVFSILRQTDGKYVVGGFFPAIGGTTRQSIARLNADGGFDATFNSGTGLNPTGSPAAGSINDMALLADGSVVLVGSFTSYNGTARSSIARAASNGALDAGLAPTATQAGNIWAISRQADGKVLIGGQFSAVNGSPRSNIARLNANGTLDTSFDPGTGVTGGLVISFAVQPDGKILLGGGFTFYNGTSVKGIARLNADGTLDTSFVVGTGIDSEVWTIAVQTNGKILLGGGFTTFNSVSANNIVCLNADGSRDTSFAMGTGVNGLVHKIAVQADGKILLGGEFSTYNGSARARLMRLNADASVDASFNPGTINSAVNDFALQADGKVALVGGFTTINGTTRNRIARLNADGSLDTSFDPGAGVSGGNPNAIVAQPDGKYLVGGQFTIGGGLPKNRILRVRADGSIDHKFLSGLGPVATSGLSIRTIVAVNGKYLIGGQFETYNTSARTGLVLISSVTKAPTDFDGDGITDIAIIRHYDDSYRWTYWILFSSTGEHISFDFGLFTVDQVVPGDYDGDGITDIAIWRARSAADMPNAYWTRHSSTGQVKAISFGLDGDAAMPEDYDGDGKDDMSIWRCPDVGQVGQAMWIYRGSLNNPNGNLTYIPWGMRYGLTQFDQKDKAYPGDFDGDGRADFRAVRRVDTSVGTLSTPAVIYTLTASGNFSQQYFGLAGDRHLPGDYDGDGKTDIAIVRGHNIGCSSCVTTWFTRSTGGAPDQQFVWGAGALDQFGPGDYDGDGIIDVTVYRRGGENNYYIRRSSDLSMMVVHWGKGDDPVVGPAQDIPVAWYRSY
jgi:uncharacterized delta-60 repeat protein